jgi:hypothetical protein
VYPLPTFIENRKSCPSGNANNTNTPATSSPTTTLDRCSRARLAQTFFNRSFSILDPACFCFDMPRLLLRVASSEKSFVLSKASPHQPTRINWPTTTLRHNGNFETGKNGGSRIHHFVFSAISCSKTYRVAPTIVRAVFYRPSEVGSEQLSLPPTFFVYFVFSVTFCSKMDRR